MTGYGEAARTLEDVGTLRVEMRAVNHRFLNTSVRTPPGFDRMEQEVTGWLRPFLARGHVQVQVALEPDAGAREAGLPELDLSRARHYAALLSRLGEELGVPSGADAVSIARLGDVLRAPEGGPKPGDVVGSDVLRELVEEAARALVATREAEGSRLRSDMEERVGGLRSELERVARLAPARIERERDRLREAVRELTSEEDVDEDRLAREIAYLAEKWDLNEEVVRLGSHLDWFAETLAAEDGEPLGKRLSFVVQEMHREVNTMGSKANDAEIARATVAMKEEIERLREQVENVE